MAGRLILKRGKDKPLHYRHPWIFSGAIASVEDAEDGATVEICDAQGEWLARAMYNSRSQITARVWTFERDQAVDREFLASRLEQAIELRSGAIIGDATAYRLVNAESDGLPGLIVDRYGDFLVLQFLTLGIERQKQTVVEVLDELLRPRGIHERGDVDVRKKEGLGLANGVLSGEEPPDRIETVENGFSFLVDVKHGHKTGFYLDQRENRLRALPYLSGEVLNAFAYTGAFGVYAGRGGATRVLNLDTSAVSLDLARENFGRNGFSAIGEFLLADAFEQLRQFREQGRRFDAIVLDPPKFAASAGQLQRALRGYKDINLLGFSLLRPGGTLVTFSCSGLVSPDLFQKVVFGAGVDARREGQILEKLLQAPDHPILLSFPEAEYLTGLILRVL